MALTLTASPGPCSLHSFFSKSLGLAAISALAAPEDPSAGAVVLLELDDMQRRKVTREMGQIVEGRATPSIDGLVVVAHRGERGACADELSEQPILARIGVLDLVDQQVTQA